MGICSYCYQYKTDECFGWDQARGCGIVGPDDPVRVERKRAYNADMAKKLRAEAVTVLKHANQKAKALKLSARNYERDSK